MPTGSQLLRPRVGIERDPEHGLGLDQDHPVRHFGGELEALPKGAECICIELKFDHIVQYADAQVGVCFSELVVHIAIQSPPTGVLY